jgi:hypothetical protein
MKLLVMQFPPLSRHFIPLVGGGSTNSHKLHSVFRAFLCVGFFLSALWAGIHVCAPDAFAWSLGLVFLNAVHTAVLTCRFLPPPLSLELTELYLKLFKPLRVSKKHFKELTREGHLLRLEPGEAYAVEEVTPADERLSVLLRGK